MHGRVGSSEEAASAGHRARLRKRLLDAGPTGFHDYELVEYLLKITVHDQVIVGAQGRTSMLAMGLI